MSEYQWIYSVNTYLYIMERINEHFNTLRTTMKHDEIEEEAFYLCTELLRMVPFKGNKEVKLVLTDGICLLRNNISFLIEDLNKILQKNAEIFKKIKRIRNKYEHEPHNVDSAFSTGSGAFSGIGFYCKKELISINSMEFTYIIYDLNKLMNKVQNFIYKVEIENVKLDVFTKWAIKIAKERKNIEYNNKYSRIPRLVDLD